VPLIAKRAVGLLQAARNARGTSYVDHFLPRDAIVGLDTDFTDVIQLSAPGQMEALAALGWRYDRQPAGR
jgi:hypothetical protein